MSKKKTNKQKKRESRRKEDKLTPQQIKRLGLDHLNKTQLKEVENMRAEIRKIGRIGASAGISGKKGGRRKANSSYEDQVQKALKIHTGIYLETGKTLMKQTHEDVSKHIREHYSNNYSANAMISAVGFIQNTLDECDVYRVPPVLLQRNEDDTAWTVKEDEPERDWVRRSEDSTTLHATKEDINAVLEKIEDSKFEHKEQAYDILKLTSLTGHRVSGALDLTIGDIMLNDDGSVFLKAENDLENEKEGFQYSTYHQEKGGHHRDVEYTEVRDPEAIEMLRELRSRFPEDASPDRRVFEMRTQIVRDKEGKYAEGGQIMDDKSARIKLANIVTECAKKADVNREGKTFSIHSGRGYFAQSRVNHYAKNNMEELKKEVNRRISINKKRREEEQQKTIFLKAQGLSQKEIDLQIKKYPDFEKKYDTLLERINWVNKSKGIRRTKEDREPNHKELVYFLSSLDIGHQRVDVIRFYAVYQYPGE